MSASQSTTNMQLPLFVGSDKLERTDWNSAMNAIDGAVGSNVINIYPQQFVSTGGSNIAEQCNNLYQQIVAEMNRLESVYGTGKIKCEINIHTGLSWGYLRQCDPSVPWVPRSNSTWALSGIATEQRHTLHFQDGQVSQYLVSTSYSGTANQLLDRTTYVTSGVRGAQVLWYIYR